MTSFTINNWRKLLPRDKSVRTDPQ